MGESFSRRQVFFNCNERGILPISVAVFSLLKSADPGRPLAIHLAHDAGFAAKGGCDRVREVVNRFPFATIEFHDVTAVLAAHPELGGTRWPPMVWAWAFCTEIIPDITGNLVFIDWDMYVRHDLEELYSLDLRGRGMITAAVDESRREHRPYLVAAGWPEAAGYSVNTGLQVIDTDAYRSERVLERMLEWYARYRDVADCVEQDAINAVIGEKILRLHLKYNFTVGWLDRLPKNSPFRKEWRVYPTRMVFEACADPYVLHFIGHKKPWAWNHRPYRNVYRKAMAELGLLDGPLFGETPSRRVIGVACDAMHLVLTGYARLMCATFFRSCR